MQFSSLKIVISLLFAVTVSGLAVADKVPPIVSEQVVQSTTSWNNNVLPAYPKGQPEVTVLKITVQPGVELPWHTHPIINVGYMLKGILTVITKSGQVSTLHAGDAIVEVVGPIHKGINNGDEPVEILVFYAGIKGKSITDLHQ